MHGGAGVSQDFPLARMWTAVRTLRLADGPDAVHRRVIAKRRTEALFQRGRGKMSAGAFPEDTRALDAWAGAHVPGFAGPSVATKFATGQSNPTYLIENAERALCAAAQAARQAAEVGAYGRARISRDARAQRRRLSRAARARAVRGRGVAGSVFYLMSHVEGRIFWDPGMAEVDARGARRRLRRDERRARAAARDRHRGRRARRLRQARQLLRAAMAALERAISRQRDRRDRRHEPADRLARRATCRPTTAASRWSTATIASTT